VKRALPSLLLGAGALLVPATAVAWDSPEHTSFGSTAFTKACAATSDKIACGDSSMSDLAGKALAQPDFCHSFWFSDVAIGLNADDSASRQHCAIQFGTPNSGSGFAATITSGVKSLDQSMYALITNANHFGDNTHTHWLLYHQIAMKAARLRAQLLSVYATPPSSDLTTPNPLLKTCTQDAIAIEGFALHYFTDRAAGGHAWNPEPRYTGWTPISMSGLRACIHGQDRTTRSKLASTGFSCLDSPLLGTSGAPIHQGLGQVGRSFGADQWQQGLWTSDDAFSSSPPAQVNAVGVPAEQAFEEVLNAMNGNTTADPTWNETFVSNQDFCAVALSECCRSASSTSLGTCDYCNPDITDSELKSSCPVDHVQSASVSGTGWVPLAGGTLGGSLYYAHVNLTGTRASNIDVAKSIAISMSSSTTHPDATWDQSNDIVTRLGCAQFDIASATVPSAPVDGSNVKTTVTYDGNPKFPVIIHWRPNTDSSKGAVCKAPSDNPHLCDARDYTVSTKPAGTTALTPQPLSVDWACPGATGSKPAAGQGFLYLTDSTSAWTPPYPAAVNCGGADAGASDGGTSDSGQGGVDASLLDGSFSSDGSTGDGGFSDGSIDSGDGSTVFGDASVTFTDAGLINGNCTHDVCTAGERLGQQCDSCTMQVCAQGNDPYCCTTLWGPSCFTAVQNLCGQTCAL